MHGQISPKQQIPKLENSQRPLLHPPPCTTWFACIIWPGWWYSLRSSTGACVVVCLVGGGNDGSLGDWRGFASGATVIVSLRVGASGLTFSGRGPGEFGGGDLGGLVYVAYWGDIWRLRLCCSLMVYCSAGYICG
jgi:hypothetical protein